MSLDAFDFLCISQDKAYYLQFDGAIAYQLLGHLQEIIAEKNFNVNLEDVTQRVGIISIQGPNR